MSLSLQEDINMDVQFLESEYYKKLDLFKDLCGQLNKKNLKYITVMLNHELYRFLYPTEPYLNFQHTEPLKHIVGLISRLCSAATACLGSFSSYPQIHHHSAFEEGDTPLERRTSNLYTSLWAGYSDEVYLEESKEFILRRLKQDVIDIYVKDKYVLDLGCGSGRNSLALSMLGAKKVVGMDYHKQSFFKADEMASKKGLNIEFVEGNALELPFKDNEFDFVYSNGVLHHTRDWRQSLSEYFRVMKFAGFIYLYATGGIFWTTRKVQREIFKDIPQDYALNVLHMMGMPKNRMIFMDVWYVPIEDHLSKEDLERSFKSQGTSFKKLVSNNPIDLDYALEKYPNGSVIWGEGEHRYLVVKSH